MTASVAAIAEAPQIPVPTPIRVRRSLSIDSARPSSRAPRSATARVPSRTGSDDDPVVTTWWKDNPVPSTMIDPCRTDRLANPSPTRAERDGWRKCAIAMPPRMAKTGAPTTGARWPSKVATPPSARAKPKPGRRTDMRPRNERSESGSGSRPVRGATRVIVPVPTRSTVRRFACLQKTGSRLLVISLPYAPC